MSDYIPEFEHRTIVWDPWRLEFKALADAAPLMVWISDPDGYCLYLNQKWYEFTAQSPGDGEGAGWTQAVHPDDRLKAWKAFSGANAGHVAYTVEYRLRRPNGDYSMVRAAARPYRDTAGKFRGYLGIDTAVEDHAIQSSIKILTERERQVVRCVARGLTAEDAASELFITSRTVEHHMHMAALRLGTSNRIQTVVEAIRRGEISI